LAEADGVDAIKALIAEASQQTRRARGRRDATGHMIAVAQRMAAKRRGGALLLASVIDAASVSAPSAQRWRRQARLSEAEFRAAVESGDEDAGRRPPAPACCPQLVMTRTEFSANELGNLGRLIFAVDVSVTAKAPTVNR